MFYTFVVGLAIPKFVISFILALPLFGAIHAGLVRREWPSEDKQMAQFMSNFFVQLFKDGK